MNLARDEFERAGVPILDFNPWMFSCADQLVESFFVALAVQLKVRPGLAEVGRDLEDYGETFSGLTWLPLVGPWTDAGMLLGPLVMGVLADALDLRATFLLAGGILAGCAWRCDLHAVLATR